MSEAMFEKRAPCSSMHSVSPLFTWPCFFTKSPALVVLKRLMRLHGWVSIMTMASVTKSGGCSSGWNAAYIVLYSHCAKVAAPHVVYARRRGGTVFLSARTQTNGSAPRRCYIKKQNPRVPLQAVVLSALVAPKLFLKMARGLFSAWPSRLARSRRE